MNNKMEYDWRLSIEAYINEVLPNLILQQQIQLLCKHRWRSFNRFTEEDITYTNKQCKVCGVRQLMERKNKCRKN